MLAALSIVSALDPSKWLPNVGSSIIVLPMRYSQYSDRRRPSRKCASAAMRTPHAVQTPSFRWLHRSFTWSAVRATLPSDGIEGTPSANPASGSVRGSS